MSEPDIAKEPVSLSQSPGHRSLPFNFAQQQGVLLVDSSDGPHVLTHGQPAVQVLTELRRFLGESYTTECVDSDEFQRRLTVAYQRDNNEAVQMAEDIGADVDLSRLADEIPESGDLMDAADDAPIIRLINAILSQAVREEASDVHIETFEDRLSVRYRIDGVLAEVLSPKRALAPLLVSRLKVMAKLDIAEKRVPQDGRISVRIAGHAVDIRMSTIPSAHGERVVLRLLDTAAGQLKLEQLNMNEQVLEAYRRHLHSPHGIILVTGPTGSGKTTTLYAGLSHINESSRNIMTIEDPVEYMLPGVGQTQVNTKVDMTFARGLRAILRQDPDVVMVGEIRDLETGEIAVQASLTGHLVLSTLHTNTAIGAITRLKDMGIEPFLVSSSLLAVMSQRLVRLLCTACREAAPATKAEREVLALETEKEVQLFHPRGCDKCNYTGYRGRTGIYEMIEVDDKLRGMIYENASEQEMLAHARQAYPSMQADGRRRILTGETSLAEVMRVTSVA
ncbi:MAG: type II secretion system ATPase GspE [Halioglobus sp.]|nr:type II secretion system ATPase GspE [Halieaceae bacterium]MDG1389313.1 type II secretion system ATPase GspE [Halioglobus sp.]